MKIGFIGAGNMARSMIRGLLASGIPAEDIFASDKFAPSRESVHQELKIETTDDNHTIAQGADVLFLAVKPHFYQEVIEEVRDDIRPETIVVSMTLGKKLAEVRSFFGRDVKLVRIMPNMAAMVLESVTAYTPGEGISDEDSQKVIELLKSFGQVYPVPETQMDAVTGVAGSGPAYIFMMIEAMAQAGIKAGLSHADAYAMAAQTAKGSAKAVLESGTHPAQLRDQVCSPAGSTIEAVAVLEREGFKTAVIQAIDACVKKSKGD